MKNKFEDKSTLELIDEALLKNVVGGGNADTCQQDISHDDACNLDTCYEWVYEETDEKE